MWMNEGQGWLQISELALAFVLSALIGLEREIRHKSAGLRTHTLVGFAAALIMVVSKYGFNDVLSPDRIVLDPSRVAAQIVTGIGFIGGGLIFVRRDNVRGLTTAAIVWLTAAVGMACGAGLPILALVAAGFHFIVVLVFPFVVHNLPRSRWTPSRLRVGYQDGRGVLREVLVACTQADFTVSRVHVERQPAGGQQGDGRSKGLDESDGSDDAQLAIDAELNAAPAGGKGIVILNLEIQGIRSVAKLATKLAEIPGVVSVNAGDVNVQSD
jgi:putative Mg2+ transporter-C (MgtC) family protein